jgi:uncharacterized protein YcbK (DUF882 family)
MDVDSKELMFWFRGELAKVSVNFTATEFECRCGRCILQCIHPELIQKLELLRKRTGLPIHINSGFRCPENNLAVGGKIWSQHQYGNAVDIMWGNWKGDEMANAASEFFDSIGVGEKFIHVDLRKGVRRWRY